MAKFKEKCRRCKKNYVVVSWRNRFPVCYDCQKSQLDKPIEDPVFKKMFSIPEKFYKENMFLRDIKLKYLQFSELTEKQIEAFKKVVKEMKEGKDD
ncbi:hypothetical protein HOI26_00045 [Candidatus Woesearchaeota archaeon]|jgi:hypothetical protein|nr:hypothetical protein [Candidatus Woesearchaeota archaeon]MBT5739465.1 hypothetical protein [Candidatus Woesearchaeota archaeon]